MENVHTKMRRIGASLNWKVFLPIQQGKKKEKEEEEEETLGGPGVKGGEEG